MESEFCKVVAIIRPDYLEQVEATLKALRVPGVSVTKVKGYGEYANFYRPDWMCTQVRLEIFISVQQAEKIAVAIMEAAHTGLAGDGVVAILPVASVYRIRTRQKCRHDVCD